MKYAMPHRTFPEHAGTATICAYFWVGIVVGVVPFEHARAWADAVIASSGSPPEGIAGIAMAVDRDAALDALHFAASGADHDTAGRWLLRDLLDRLRSGEITVIDSLHKAMQVAQAAGLPDDVHERFDVLEDALQSAVEGVYGSPEDVARKVIEAFERYAAAP
ncbi:hypothetical protein ACQQ2N_06095 [Dokdonella sp. MW10]|uniref:hypothetical protein n=1 Tax=Dokdonella sp. MW10 TaxID=2992926 RepID=UPI003F8201A9